MGFWRVFGYVINIIGIIVCLVIPYGIIFILLPIVFIVILRRGAVREKRHNELLDAVKKDKMMK